MLNAENATMKCEEASELLEALHDDELDPQTRAAVLEHLQTCSDCARALKELEALRSAIAKAERFVAPPELRARILRAVNDRSTGITSWHWRTTSALAASYAAVVILAGSIAYEVTSTRLQYDFAVQEAVAAHVRSLLDERAPGVTSNDQHTVRPWFAGKLDFSPAVANLEPEGFPLLGARVDYVANRYQAALEYGRRNHKITVFVAPSEGERFDAPRRTSRNGYNIVEWTSGDLNYRAVSDLNDQELQEFAALMQQNTAK
jgi:anti-sigma factor RsiW